MKKSARYKKCKSSSEIIGIGGKHNDKKIDLRDEIGGGGGGDRIEKESKRLAYKHKGRKRIGKKKSSKRKKIDG